MNTDGTGFSTCKECHKTESLWNHTTTDHKEVEQLEDRRNVGKSSCNFGDGMDQRVHSLMFIMMIFFETPGIRFKTFQLIPRARRISFRCILNFSSCPERVQQICLWLYLPVFVQCSFSTTHAISTWVHKKLVLLSTVLPIPAGVLFYVQDEDGNSSNVSRHYNSHVTTHNRKAMERCCDVCQFVPTGPLICDMHWPMFPQALNRQQM